MSTTEYVVTIHAPDFTCPDCNMPQGKDYATSHPNRRSITQGEERIEFDLCDRCAAKNYTPKQRMNRGRVIWNRVTKKPDEYVSKTGTSPA